jgi:hypothetical protein
MTRKMQSMLNRRQWTWNLLERAFARWLAEMDYDAGPFLVRITLLNETTRAVERVRPFVVEPLPREHLTAPESSASQAPG